MTDAIVSGLIGLAGSGVGAMAGIVVQSKLTSWRLEQIEKRLALVDEHTKSIVEIEGRLREIEHDIRDIKGRLTSADV